jgi:2-polyprenyl-6-methoxyphenol hydroxylase-like FAD-dependent oxidoreductase
VTYDLITIGGGLGGAALAQALAARGARVLVLERTTRFTDRVRGEALHPWGLAEARALGIEAPLRAAGGREVRWWRSSTRGDPRVTERDLLATTPHGAGELTLDHAAMQERLLEAAATAGATVRRGAAVVGLAPGPAPAVTVRAAGGAPETLRARLVVGADGRASRARAWAGLALARDPARLAIAGVLLDGMRLPDDGVRIARDPARGAWASFFPLGGGRFRAYFQYHRDGPPRRLSGAAHLPAFLAACVAAGADPAWLAGATAAGPLAAFDGGDRWVDHPYRAGVALLGDAAATSDPCWGCGLALTLRDARALRDALLAGDDWEAAGHAYAAAHDGYYGALHRLGRWRTALAGIGPAAEALRARVAARTAVAPGRAPDVVGLGPDGPSDAATLHHFS